MPQMSPMQWTIYFNYFTVLMITSSIIINFITINNNMNINKIMHTKKFITPKW